MGLPKPIMRYLEADLILRLWRMWSVRPHLMLRVCAEWRQSRECVPKDKIFLRRPELSFTWFVFLANRDSGFIWPHLVSGGPIRSESRINSRQSATANDDQGPGAGVSLAYMTSTSQLWRDICHGSVGLRYVSVSCEFPSHRHPPKPEFRISRNVLPAIG